MKTLPTLRRIARSQVSVKWITLSLLAAAIIVLAAMNPGSIAAEPKPRGEGKIFMRTKLAWSSGVVEGLTLEKYDLVTQNAIRLRNMTHSNLWFVIRQPDYLVQTTNFQKSVEGLYMAAIDKNLEASTEAYLKMMRDCVDCHRVVRVSQRQIGRPAIAPRP